MYKEDVRTIANYAVQSPANLFDVGLFVQATISQHFEIVPRIVADFRANGLETRFFCGRQKGAIKTLLSEQEKLHRDLRQWRRHGRNGASYALRGLLELPGFGFAKAGFFAQLLGFEVGCLDRHNIRLYGLSERAFSHVPVNAEGLTKKIETYLTVCRHAGGAEHLWDTWCSHVAQLRPKSFADAESVSKLHVQCIVREG